MKTPLLAAVCLFATSLPAASWAADQVPAAQSEYAQAVQVYVDAAGDQLASVRGELDRLAKSATSDDAKKQFELVYPKLDRSDAVLVELKSAGPADFDRIKQKFERIRADMLKALDKANREN